MDFKKQAEKLLKEVLHEYHNRPKWNKKSLGEMVDFHLAKYSEDVKKKIEDELYKQLGSFYFINTNPQITITPVMLSDILYKNAKDTAKLVTKILHDGIKAKDTIGEIAKKLYEGYGFKDKEVLDLMDKNLPKYIRQAMFNPYKQKQVMKQVEKLKTKPLRIAYKDIFKKLDEMNAEAIEKAMKTALEEKARYFANRIAKTETHRAFMSMRAKEMLEDDEVEFVKYEMSSAHKKTDICDFYANLDVGYGRGIIPKNEMRTLPLHPHCYCVYTPYYQKVKGKRKSWKRAVKETMNKFSEKKQIEILGSREKLMRFKNGEDIEKIFNAIRPKYQIKKYVDLFGQMSENFESESVDIKLMLEEIKSKKKFTKNKIIVGKLHKDVIKFLETRDIPIHTQEIYLTHKGLSHLARDSKQKRGAGLSEDDILKIPKIISNPNIIYFDSKKNKLNLLYCKFSNNCEKLIKIVIDTKSYDKKLGKVTLIKTAGYIVEVNLKDEFYIKVETGGR